MRKKGELSSFDVDLGSTHELTRVAAVLKAIGDTWDPAAVYTGETEAYRLLYSGLSAEQQAIYDELAAAGLLP